MANLSSDEMILVDELRSRVSSQTGKEEYYNTGHFLVRWIRAREGDVEKAEKMLLESLEWRELHQIHLSINNEIPKDVYESLPYSLSRKDNLGRLVFEFPYGRWDLKRIVNTYGEDMFFHYTNKILEQIIKAIREVSEDPKSSSGVTMNKTQAVFIADCEGYSYSQLWCVKGLQSMFNIVSKYEAHYPEITAAIIGINAPPVFMMFFALIKPFFAGNTLKKIRIFGPNKAEWGPIIQDLGLAGESVFEQ